jgi:hypothetical protein
MVYRCAGVGSSLSDIRSDFFAFFAEMTRAPKRNSSPVRWRCDKLNNLLVSRLKMFPALPAE